MTVGIAIDAWKLAVFKRHLDAAGFEYTEHPGITDGTLLLKVECDSPHELQKIVAAAQKECARKR